MRQKVWVDESRKILVCVDSYADSNPCGWFFLPGEQAIHFTGLTQFLLKIDGLLDENRLPQAYAPPKSFSLFLKPDGFHAPPPIPKGARATFELKILFRQHTSWQGVLLWRECGTEQSFRSVLELVMLMDSALKSMEGCEAV